MLIGGPTLLNIGIGTKASDTDRYYKTEREKKKIAEIGQYIHAHLTTPF